MDSHSETGHLQVLGMPSPPHPSFARPPPPPPTRSLQGLSHPGQSPMCLVQEPPGPAMGPAEGDTVPNREEDPAPSLLPSPPTCDCQEMGACNSAPPPFLHQRSRVGQTSLSSPASPPSCFIRTCVSLRFSKDQKTKTPQNKNKKPTKKKKPIKRKELKTFRELLFTLLTYGFII